MKWSLCIMHNDGSNNEWLPDKWKFILIYCCFLVADMWMPWGRSQQCTRRSAQSCPSFAQSPAFLLAPARYSILTCGTGGFKLKYGAGGFKLKYISGAEKQGDKSPAKPGSVGEGAGSVWVPGHNRELGACRGAEGRTWREERSDPGGDVRPGPPTHSPDRGAESSSGADYQRTEAASATVTGHAGITLMLKIILPKIKDVENNLVDKQSCWKLSCRQTKILKIILPTNKNVENYLFDKQRC